MLPACLSIRMTLVARSWLHAYQIRDTSNYFEQRRTATTSRCGCKAIINSHSLNLLGCDIVLHTSDRPVVLPTRHLPANKEANSANSLLLNALVSLA